MKTSLTLETSTENAQTGSGSIQKTMPKLWGVGLLGMGSLLFIVLLATLVDETFLLSSEIVMIPALALFFLLPTAVFFRKASFRIFESSLSPALQFVLIIALSSAVIFAVFGRALDAQWAVYDDHEVIRFLGPDRRLGWSEFVPTLFEKTEIGFQKSLPRYRPFYFMARLIETIVWGYNVTLWHAFRLVIFAACAAGTWLALRKHVGFWEGGLVVLYTLTFPLWVDIFTRLGPGETYTVPGLLLFVVGFFGLIIGEQKSTKLRWLSWLAVSAGGVICIGSKENFLLLILPMLYLAWRSRSNRADWLPCSIAVGVNLALAALVAGMVGWRIRQQNWSDVYSASVSPLDRFTALFDQEPVFIFSHLLPILFMIAVGLAALAWLSRQATHREQIFSQTIKPFLIWLAVLIFLYASQLFFYNWNWPEGSRYDFPGILVIPACILLLYWLGLQVTHLNPPLNKLVRAAFMLTLLLTIIGKGFGTVTKSVDYLVTQSQAFSQSVQELTTFLRDHPDHALLIQSHQVRDYEAIFSYSEYLRAAGIENDIFVSIEGIDQKKLISPLEKDLYQSLQVLSNEGGNDEADFQPIHALSDFGTRCYALNLSGVTPSNCMIQSEAR